MNLINQDYTLIRDGKPPLKFTGAIIGTGSNRTAQGVRQNRWTEVNIYRTRGGRYVAAVNYHTQGQGEPQYDKAESFGAADAMLEWLRDDNGGTLGGVAQEALASAAKNDSAIDAAYVEVVA